jgi:hypothetical protein
MHDTSTRLSRTDSRGGNDTGLAVIKLSSHIPISVSVGMVLWATALCAAEVPSQTLSFNSATIGVTALGEVQKVYGAAEPVRVSNEEEADVAICYMHSSKKGESFLIFESGIMGGYKDITGFRISTIRPSINCVATKIDVGALRTKNGVRLGQSLEAFKKTVPVMFTYHGSRLAYEGVGQRPATQEELKMLRSKWPNTMQNYFDVTTNIEAEFLGNRLVDFYIRKIESY